MREQLDSTLKQVDSKERKFRIASLPVTQCTRDSFLWRCEILNKVLGRSFTIISFIFLSLKEILACFGVSYILYIKCIVESIYLLAPYIWLL